MNSLQKVLDWYISLTDSQKITSQLLLKSTKGGVFRGTVFLNRQLDEVQQTLQAAQRELSDLIVVSLVAHFEERLASHLGEGFIKLQGAVDQFKPKVHPATFEDAQRLCDYRHWVAHGKRWPPPAQADPTLAHMCLSEFLKQSGID